MEYTPSQESARFRNTLDYLVLHKQITPQLQTELLARDFTHSAPPQPYAWIGVNPSGQTMTEIHAAASALPYDDYIYTLEQNTANGIKPHLHCLAKVTTSTRPNLEIPKLASLFKTPANYIEFKISKNKKLKNQRLKYVYGEKCPDKQLNCEKDIKDRISLGLQNYYLKGHI